MRVFLAVIPADRISRCAILTAGVLCGALAFSVVRPLALSSPFPTPRQEAWVVQRSSVRVASLVPTAFEIEPITDLEPEIVTASLGSSPEDEPLRALAPMEAPISGPIDGTDKRASRRGPDAGTMDEVDQYLWDVYQRAPVKRDSSGDFTWKDPAAAKRLGMPLKTYVIAGMEPDFREQLYHAGKAMDAAGVRWAILSAFRDDYRQGLASGFKAHAGNSLHGGSRRTGGYGYGRAVDVTSADGDVGTVWRWLDAHGSKYGLHRPMPGADPAHVQPRGLWHNLAMALRHARTAAAKAVGAPAPEAAAEPAGQDEGFATASR